MMASGGNERSLETTLLLNCIDRLEAFNGQLSIIQANLGMLLDDRGRAAEGRKAIYQKLEDVGVRLATCEGTVARIAPQVDGLVQDRMTLARIAPQVDELVEDRMTRDGVKEGERRLFKRWHAVVVGGAGAATWAAHEWDRGWAWVARLLGKH